ncbi:hypothetical protein [Streptomyces sp. NRRL F-5727]|uniref:hypothetical protein n=1 Tax=Streptomyces sp. NRRL F-5727 TaxID=1463871 RepID=UPI000A9707CC|nr:hypothetical protein [Streptomyces sp. NRRL F-5727]
MLVPDDPVFFATFQSLEEPLLRHLYRLHAAGLDCDDGRILSDAYDSWVQVLLRLPGWPEGHAHRTEPAPDERAGYVLYGTHGDPLPSLYPIEVTAVELGHLTACLDLFAARDRALPALPGQPAVPWVAEQPERDRGLADVFRRVLQVLLLPPPRRLLAAVRHVVLTGAKGSMTLPADQEREYRRFCEDIVTILSSGDAFAHRSHWALYF